MAQETINLDSLVQDLRANDSFILEKPLAGGLEICLNRSDAFDKALVPLLNNIIEASKPEYEFVIGAVGGYGRRQLRPNSDLDVILMYGDDVPDEDPFLMSYTDRLSGFLFEALGISDIPIKNNLSDIDKPDKFDTKKFSACLDYRRLAGSEEFEGAFLGKLKGSLDNLGFFLDMRSTLEQHFGIDTVPFNMKYGEGGLRQFNIAVHVQGAEKFEASSEVYGRIPDDAMDAYSVLLKASSWLNLRYGLNAERPKRKTSAGVQSNEIFGVADLEAFERFFGKGSIQTLHRSRRIIKQFSEKVSYERLKSGIRSSIFIYTLGGLGLDSYTENGDRGKEFYDLLSEAQKRNLNIAPKDYHNLIAEAEKFAAPRPEFMDLFHQEGNLAGTLEIMLTAGALGRTLLGFSALETSYFEDTHRNRNITRARQAINRVYNLESLMHPKQHQTDREKFFSHEYSLLDLNQLTSLKLALLCKAIPQTLGITARQYLSDLKKSYSSLDEDSLSTMEFLIDSKDLLIGTAQAELLMERSTIDSVVSKIINPERLRSLLLFTYGDLTSSPMAGIHSATSKHFSNLDWDNVILLYKRIMNRLNDVEDTGYNPEELNDELAEIAKYVPLSFFRSRHKEPISINLKHIQNVIADKNPEIVFTKLPEDYFLLQVIAENFPGLLWRVAGVCCRHKYNLQEAEIYSTSGQYNIAFDFFEIDAQSVSNITPFQDELASVIKERKDIGINAQELLRGMDIKYTLDYIPLVDKYRMSIMARDRKGLFYSVIRTLSDEVGADICATKARTLRNGRVTDVFFFSSEHPQQVVESRIAKNFDIYVGDSGRR